MAEEPRPIDVHSLTKQRIPGHPQVTHYAVADLGNLPQTLGGTLVKIDKDVYQVLGVKMIYGERTGLALRRMLKVGRG
jgi:hypothetical protein